MVDWTPIEEPQHQHPSCIPTSVWSWYCGLAIGPPQWQGTDSYECPECQGEGEIAVPDEDVEVDDGMLYTFPDVWCTACGQHLGEDGTVDAHFEFVRHQGKREGVQGIERFQIESVHRQRKAEADGGRGEGGDGNP